MYVEMRKAQGVKTFRSLLIACVWCSDCVLVRSTLCLLVSAWQLRLENSRSTPQEWGSSLTVRAADLGDGIRGYAVVHIHSCTLELPAQSTEDSG